MNEWVKVAGLAAAVILIQVATGPMLQVGGARPDFLLIYILMVSLQRGRLGGLLLGFSSGLVIDLLSIGPIGVHAFAKSTIAFWVGVWLDDRVGSVSVGWWMALLSFAAFLQAGLIGITGGSAGGDFGTYLFTVSLPSAIYTSLVGLLWAIAPMGTRSRGPLAPASTRGRRSLR